jgi:spore germination protein
MFNFDKKVVFRMNIKFIDIKEYEKRSIEESLIEPTIRGSRDSFSEDLRTNITLVRRRLKTSKLKMEELEVGRLSRTKVVISYIDGIVDNSLVKEVQKKYLELILMQF